MRLNITGANSFASLIGSSSCLFVQFGNKAVAQAACDVFQLLISHWEQLQRFNPTLPKKIIEVTHTYTHVSTHKIVITTLIPKKLRCFGK